MRRREQAAPPRPSVPPFGEYLATVRPPAAGWDRDPGAVELRAVVYVTQYGLAAPPYDLARDIAREYSARP